MPPGHDLSGIPWSGSREPLFAPIRARQVGRLVDAPPGMPWQTATRMIVPPHDGLSTDWSGRVWLNPPFGKAAGAWVEKLAQHGNGIALTPARTETKWFYWSVWYMADAICFVKGRPHFYRPDGTRGRSNSGAPIALAAYGEENVQALMKSTLGIVVRMQK